MISSSKLPAGWQIKSIGSFSKVTTGATPLRAKHDRYFTGGNIPWIKTTDLNNSDIVDCEENITELAVKENSCSVLPENTVLVAMYGGFRQIGRTGILRMPAATNQALSAIRVNEKEVTPYFLLHYLNENVSQWKRLAASSRKDPNITRQDVLDYEVVLPPLFQQEKIVAIASTWDNAIALELRHLQQLRQRKKEIARSLLSQELRLAGFHDKWELVPLRLLFQRVTRPNHRRAIKVMSITARRGFESQDEKFSRVIAGENIAKYVLLQKDEFAYNKGNSGLHPYGVIYKLEEDEAAVPNVYLSFKGNAETDAEFYQHYFLSGAINSQLSRVINSGVRNDGLLNLSAEDFFNVSVHRVPLAEQRAIAELLNTADAEIKLHERQLEALREQKRGLLQKLLNGEILLS